MKHAGARHATVEVSHVDAHLQIVVADRGVGFDSGRPVDGGFGRRSSATFLRAISIGNRCPRVESLDNSTLAAIQNGIRTPRNQVTKKESDSTSRFVKLKSSVVSRETRGVRRYSRPTPRGIR